jgi:hypothetical protein
MPDGTRQNIRHELRAGGIHVRIEILSWAVKGIAGTNLQDVIDVVGFRPQQEVSGEEDIEAHFIEIDADERDADRGQDREPERTNFDRFVPQQSKE